MALAPGTHDVLDVGQALHTVPRIGAPKMGVFWAF